ncbi:phosphonate C-P lyase system protein PhnH [Cohnella sp.]|uniref:phosphonate C-P lyase system protein PhnH n=1 Tax=Cohnella sp. TaxID=1883426 RepID=UPI003567B60C
MLNPSGAGFDRVHDTQHIYRILLHAMSRPGVICELGELVQRIDVPSGTSKAAAAIAYTLLDGEVSFASCMWEQVGWPEHIRRMTYSKLVEMSVADYVFVNGEEDAGSIEIMISKLKIGTLSSPEQSATLCIKVNSLRSEPDMNEAGISLKLTGPGIEGSSICCVDGLSSAWIESRSGLVQEYPLGVDFVLFTESGEVLALPRTTVVEGVVGAWPTLQ